MESSWKTTQASGHFFTEVFRPGSRVGLLDKYEKFSGSFSLEELHPYINSSPVVIKVNLTNGIIRQSCRLVTKKKKKKKKKKN